MSERKLKYETLEVLDYNFATREFDKKKLRVTKMWDMADFEKDAENDDYLAKLYITKPNKKNIVKYVIECNGIRWIDTERDMSDVPKAAVYLGGYVEAFRRGFYLGNSGLPKNIELTRLINNAARKGDRTDKNGEASENPESIQGNEKIQ